MYMCIVYRTYTVFIILCLAYSVSICVQRRSGSAYFQIRNSDPKTDIGSDIRFWISDPIFVFRISDPISVFRISDPKSEKRISDPRSKISDPKLSEIRISDL